MCLHEVTLIASNLILWVSGIVLCSGSKYVKLPDAGIMVTILPVLLALVLKRNGCRERCRVPVHDQVQGCPAESCVLHGLQEPLLRFGAHSCIDVLALEQVARQLQLHCDYRE